MSEDERVLFDITSISSIKDAKRRIKHYFILLHKIENLIIDNPDIAHKCLYIKIADNSHYLMDFSAFYINATLWLFNIVFDEPIITEDVHDMSEATKGTYIKIMDKIISKFIRLGHDLDAFNIIGTVKEKIIRIARFYGEITCNTFSLYDIMALQSRRPDFAELFNTPLDPEKMSISQVEKYLKVAKDRLYDIVIDDKQNCLYPFVSTGIVRAVQMGQMFIAVGPRFDIDKSIMPVMIKRGWIHGMTDPSEFYVEAVTNRNAIIVKKKSVPDSGYMSRKVNIACLNTHMDSRIYDCGTTHYLNYFIENEKHLQFIEGKYMVVDDNGPIVREITNDDKDLIGSVVRLRSHTKCITGHKLDKVCCICLGNKHKTLNDSRIGGLVGICLINPLTQLGLSAKHAVATKSEEVDGEIITKYFNIANSNMYVKKESIHKHGLSLMIPLDIVTDIISYDIVDGEVDEGIDLSKSINSLFIVNGGVLEYVNFDDKSFMVNISDNLVSLISSGVGTIARYEDVVEKIGIIEGAADLDIETLYQDTEFFVMHFNSFDQTEEIFNIKLLTEEVSKYLKITRSIIDGAKTYQYKNIEEIIYDFFQVLIRADQHHHGMLIHMETLFMNLMRSATNVIERPDYSTDFEPEIQFVRLTQAIQKSDLFSGIVFEDIKRQFELADLLKKRTPGIYDIFFNNSEFARNGEEFKKTRPYIIDRG